MRADIIEKLTNLNLKDGIKTDEPMSRHTTFRCGGNAAVYLTPADENELSKIISTLKDEEYIVIGNGSNLLVRDEGYDGVVIDLSANFKEIDVIGEEIEAQAGASMAMVAIVAMDNELAGFEFGHGIPGTIGGAVTMNAGAYGGEMKDVLTSVKVIDKDGQIKDIPASELELGYRTSRVMKEGLTVISARMKFSIGFTDEIGEIMEVFMQRRRAKQPLEYPSAGSTFKRPEGYFAGKLIQDAGLGGYRLGGAMVSDKHCGFIINYDNATATDVLNLIEYVQNKVYEDTGVMLEPEVRIV